MTIQEAIEQLTKNNDEIYSLVGRVKAVDKQSKTIDVVPILNPEDTIFDVRLQADLNSNHGVVTYPKVDTNVVITFLNKNAAYVALCTEVEAVEIVVDTRKMQFDKDGLLVSSAASSLLSAWKDLLSLLKDFRLTTNVGATIAVTPDVIAKITALEAKIGGILKDS